MNETTMPGNNSPLGYARYLVQRMSCRRNWCLTHSSLMCSTLFRHRISNHFFPNNIIIACSTDGAPTTPGRYRGFKALPVPSIMSVHCICTDIILWPKFWPSRCITRLTQPWGLFTWRFKWAHQLTFLVTWHDYCWITNCLSDRMSSRESEHSTLVVAWFVSELPGKSVLAKQPP